MRDRAYLFVVPILACAIFALVGYELGRRNPRIERVYVWVPVKAAEMGGGGDIDPEELLEALKRERARGHRDGYQDGYRAGRRRGTDDGLRVGRQDWTAVPAWCGHTDRVEYDVPCWASR